MKLAIYGPERKVGAVQENRVIDLNLAYAKFLSETQDEPLPYEMAAAIVPARLDAFILSGDRAIEGAARAVEHLTQRAADHHGLRGERLIEALADVKIHAPYASRSRIMMAGGNYALHSQGMSGRGPNGEKMPLEEVYAAARKRGIWGFYCFPENAVGPGEDVIYPSRTDRLDYEGEVAVILGKRGKDIAAKDAEGYYWGYMLQNDISARTTVPTPDNPQSSFTRAKNFEGSVAGGPFIVVGEFPDAQNITWETKVNGEIRQQGNTKDMTFSFAEFVEYLSADMVLLPGDVISAGTAQGTAQDSSEVIPGSAGPNGQPQRDPKLFLKVGDVVEISNPAMGTLRNRIVAKA
ncbi:MAG TPA: fumarylacetoacetate hydrolase family protein [Dehalococcoidia bacterium]|nr:fumarylacetoacetate hydrolase family protein [Dehalococcoidia bacterium]